MQFRVDPALPFSQHVGSICIYNNGKCGVGGEISQDGHSCNLRTCGSRELYSRAERTLRLRQIIQRDNNL